MVSSTAISSILAITTIPTATPKSEVLNIINPIFALPSGKNATGPLGASIISVENSTTTYRIGCNGLYNHTKFCGWSTAPPFLVTQGSTEEHFTYSNSGDPGESVTIQGDYTFSSTLAPTITGTFLINNVEISDELITTTTDYVTSTYAETTVDAEATWYAIPVTGGLEKLSQSGSGSGTNTSGSGSATVLTTTTTTTTNAGGKRLGGGGVAAGLVGAFGILCVLML